MKNQNLVYPARYKFEDGVHQLSFIDFPNISYVEGESMDELIRSAQEQLALEILDMESMNQEIPKASEVDTDVIYIHIWMPYYRNITKEVYVKKNVTIPQWLDIMAKEKKINYSRTLAKGIKKELGIEE